jgi:hypothetical protein
MRETNNQAKARHLPNLLVPALVDGVFVAGFSFLDLKKLKSLRNAEWESQPKCRVSADTNGPTQIARTALPAAACASRTSTSSAHAGSPGAQPLMIGKRKQ